MNSSGLPHVADRWCARPVDFRVPDCLAVPRLISLSDSKTSPPEVVVGSKVCDDPPANTGARQTLNLSRALFPEDTVVVRMTAPPGESLVPTLLEIEGEINLAAIKEELQR